MRALFLVCLLVAGLFSCPKAQTVTNPDISVIADMRTVLRPADTASHLGADEISFDFEEIEFNFAGYLNPYMRADVYAALHGTGGEVELEEAAITVLRGLPARLQFRAGQYFLGFGKINTQHRHQWAWLEFPLMHRTMMGEEGLRVAGLNVSTLQPVGDTAVELSLNAFRGSDFGGHDHGEEEEEDHADGHDEEDNLEPFLSGRVSLFRSLTDALAIEIGGSYMYGETDPAEGLEVHLSGIDLKAKWRPDSERAVILVFEAMHSDRDLETEEGLTNVTATGAFTAAELRFRKRFDVGGFFDTSEDATLEGVESTAVGAWFGFMPVEDTARFSLVYRRHTSDIIDFVAHSVTFQVVWSLGPHKPHPF